ncbi:MAG: hypothetical protein RMK81_12125, partial [Geminicoccaceae bacterium]|nr:hypothetical protein [Geminicoccaceae bacterium]
MQTAVEPREAPARQGSVVITLPDGSTRRFDHPPTGREVALAIGRRLAEAAVAGGGGGAAGDHDPPIERDARVRNQRAEDPQAL